MSKPKASDGLDQANPLRPRTPAPEREFRKHRAELVAAGNQVLRAVQVEARTRA